MIKELSEQEAFLAFCLAIASQDNELNEKERAPIIKGMKEAGFLDNEHELKSLFHSTIEKISPVFKDGKAFSFDEKNLVLFAKRIKDALSHKKLTLLFDTAFDIAIADGILDVETELNFLKKMYNLFEIKKPFEDIIKERSHL